MISDIVDVAVRYVLGGCSTPLTVSFGLTSMREPAAGVRPVAGTFFSSADGSAVAPLPMRLMREPRFEAGRSGIDYCCCCAGVSS